MSFRGAIQTVIVWLLLICLPFGASATRADAAATDDGGFTRYPGLEPNVDFWIDVFASWTSSQAVVHDLEHLGIVYEVVDLPGPIGDRYTKEQKDFLKEVRTGWEYFLESLEAKVASDRPLEAIERQWIDHLHEVAGAGALEGAHDRVRSQRGMRDRFRAGLERSFRYRETMERIFREERLPEVLAYLPHVESSFQAHARSSVGASGMWQFTRGTGRLYMRVDAAIDERLDPIVATRGAARYLRDAYERLGSWPLALTSYNHGVVGMKRARERFGHDFERIYHEYDGRTFGFASRNFYTEFLAAWTIAANPEHYFPEGFEQAAALDLDHFELDRRTTADRIARAYGLSVDELAELNPAWTHRAVRQQAALPAGSLVWLPAGTLERVTVGGRLPTIESVPQTATVARQGNYVVRRGDTLSSVAAAHGTSVNTLRRLNGISRGNHVIRVGQALNLGPAQGHVVRRGETLSGIARTYHVTEGSLRTLNRIPKGSSLIRVGQKLRLPVDGPAETRSEHVVRRGETLLRIASTHGVRLVDLLALNTLTRHSTIYPGQTIRIPTR